MNVPEILSSLGFVLTSGILRQLQRPPLRLEATEFLHFSFDISKRVVFWIVPSSSDSDFVLCALVIFTFIIFDMGTCYHHQHVTIQIIP